jgi:hypothetical protein
VSVEFRFLGRLANRPVTLLAISNSPTRRCKTICHTKFSRRSLNLRECCSTYRWTIDELVGRYSQFAGGRRMLGTKCVRLTRPFSFDRRYAEKGSINYVAQQLVDDPIGKRLELL